MKILKKNSLSLRIKLLSFLIIGSIQLTGQVILSNNQAFHWANEAVAAKGLRRNDSILRSIVKDKNKIIVADSIKYKELEVKVKNKDEVIADKSSQIEKCQNDKAKKIKWNGFWRSSSLALLLTVVVETIILIVTFI